VDNIGGLRKSIGRLGHIEHVFYSPTERTVKSNLDDLTEIPTTAVHRREVTR